MVAPNGAHKTKADHPNLPVTADELAAETARCIEAGASALHMHVRDENEQHVLDAKLYLNALAKIRPLAGETILQITTEAVGRFLPDEQMQCVHAVRPEAVSIALKELIPDRNAEATAREFLTGLEENNCSVQFICYSADEVKRFTDLMARGTIPQKKPFLLFVLGRYTQGQQSMPGDLDPFVEIVSDSEITWAMCAFGKQECACALHAAQLGGHVRIGFENNMLLPNGSIATSNATLINTTVKELERHGFAPMSAAKARRLLGLPQAASLSAE